MIMVMLTRWLRLIVDEGHELAQNKSYTSGNPLTSSLLPSHGMNRGRERTASRGGNKKGNKHLFDVMDGFGVLSNAYNETFADSSPSTAFIAHIAAERR